MGVELAAHQIEVLGRLHNGCVLKAGVGVGKSRTALAYYVGDCGGAFKLNGKGSFKPFTKPRDLYIITTPKKRNDKDWEIEAAPFGLGPEAFLNVYGTRVIVDSWNNIGRYQDVTGAFFIFDEQRLVGSGSWTKAFIKIARGGNRWMLLSATPGDTWMDYIPVFVANGFYKNRTEFIRRHVVWSSYAKFPKVDHYVEVGRLANLRSRILVDVEFGRHTIRHLETHPVEYDKALFDKVLKSRWHVYEDRPLKDVGEMFIVMRKVVNLDPSRLGELMKIFEKHPKLIVFYNFNYELDMLRTLPAILDVPVAEYNGHKHEKIPEGDKWIYLVQYTAGAEGWNCVETDTTVFYSLNYSYKIFEQSLGRIDRMNTLFVDLWYYIMRSSAPIDMSIWGSLKKKKKFNEKSVGKRLWPEEDHAEKSSGPNLSEKYAA